MSSEGTSSALLVQEKLLQMVHSLVSGNIDPAVIGSAVENYISNNGVNPTSYVYDRQGVAASSWVIQHNLARYPQVTIIDDAGNQVEADINYNSVDSITITFAKPLSGKAVLS